MGTLAGFEIAVPRSWTQQVSVPLVQLQQSRQHLHLFVCMAGWHDPGVAREARYLQTRAAHTYHGYKKLLLQTIPFKSVGYTSAPAAELKFSFTNPASGVRSTEFIILVKLLTSSGDQSYSLTVSAPRGTFPEGYSVFRVALKTFRPLPAVSSSS
jgi:hypothetical protein